MSDTNLIGSQIGHFRVVDLAGTGGMGAVYVGFDERLQRRVALKALREGQLDPESRARFQREARVLSQLKHKHICQIHDLLETPAGEFLVLELIEGKNLAEFLATRPPVAVKMAIARQLAEVLVVTHAKGIIHRDLKPANVMVTPDNDVKVLDFGIARGSTIGAEDLTVARIDSGPIAPGDQSDYSVTRLGVVVGTLSHMSPEQARGETVTTATDLFSYGLILQEMFTGERAYPPGLPIAEQTERARAGNSLPVKGLAPDLTGLINRLKDPAASARPTAVDTVEWLDRIAAAPQKRRRRMLAWAAGAALAVVAVGMSYQAWRIDRQAKRIAEEAARANLEATSAREVSEFLVKIFEVSNPGQGRGESVTARELLDTAAKDIQGRLTDQPILKARLMGTLADVYQALGLYDPAHSLAEQSLALGRTGGASAEAMASSEQRLGWIHFLRGELVKAGPLLERAVAARERTLGPDSLALAASLSNLAVVRQNEGKLEEAETLHERALAIYDRVVPAGNTSVALALSDIAFLEYTQGKYTQAQEHYARAITLLEKAGGPDDPELAITLSQLGGAYRDQGKSSLAEPLMKRAVAIQEKVLGPDHTFLALRLDGLARVYFDERKLTEAESLLVRAMAIHEKALGPDHPWLAQSLLNLALVYRDQSKVALAADTAARAARMYEKTRGMESVDAAGALVVLAQLRIAQGRSAEAQPALDRALAAFGKAATLNAYPRSLEARALELVGRTDEARAKATELRNLGFGRRDFLELCKALGVPATDSRPE